MGNEKIRKILYKSIVTVSIFYLLYLCLIPTIFSNEWFVNKVCQNIVKKHGYKIEVKKPKLKTYIIPKYEFGAEYISINNEEEVVLKTQNLLINITLFLNKVIVNNISTDYIYADVNKLIDLNAFHGEEKKPKKGLKTNLYNSVLTIKSSDLLFKKDNNIECKISASIDLDNRLKEYRPIKFDIKTNINNGNEKLGLLISDNGKVYIKNKTLFVEACPIKVNSSEVVVNSVSSEEKGLNLLLSSKNFKSADIYDLINTNLIIKNGKEFLSSVKDFRGSFDFDFRITSDDFGGDVKLNKFSFKLFPLNSMPITLSNGVVKITPNKIIFNDIVGFYGKNCNNKMTLEGEFNDYIKNLQSNIVVKTKLNNEFAKDYLSHTIKVPIELVGSAGTQLVVKILDKNININIATRLQKGNDILIDNVSLSPKDYDRAVNSIMDYQNGILDIKNVDYYISETINKNTKIKPILTVNGLVDCNSKNIIIRKIGLDIPKPLPSEFLNLFARERMFKGGNFHGKITYSNYNNYPKVMGNFRAEKIRIIPQKIFLRKGVLTTDNEMLYLIADGKFKRSEFDFKGDILNKMDYPFIIKNLVLNLDYVDIEQMFNTMQNGQSVNNKQNNDFENGNARFDLKNIIIEKCIFTLVNGKYKDIKIGNLNANLSFDKNQILNISARKFDIADGTSSLKVFCDLKNKKYDLKLVAKEVNSDYMASSLLDMKKEISGKANGFVYLYSDASKKLSGHIKFSINNGAIQKVGLAEYLMKFAAIFRNPLVMISPSIITDIVNIPEGEFDKINGELKIKENIINLIRIKSVSPRLSSYVVGMYNLENNDAIIRIYTKFSKKSRGIYGFVRNFSLNTLANKFFTGNNTEANYYASEIAQIPIIEGEDEDCQIFLTKIDGDIKNNNFLSSLKKIK